jgi:hypothetical protein
LEPKEFSVQNAAARRVLKFLQLLLEKQKLLLEYLVPIFCFTGQLTLFALPLFDKVTITAKLTSHEVLW